MADKALCRVGVFYDGCYLTYARNHLYHQRKLGWLDYQPLHLLIEEELGRREPGYAAHRVVYAAWFQGLHSSGDAAEEHLRRDRNLHLDLIHAGVDPKYLPMSTQGREKGVDVAFAIDALQAGVAGKIDVAAFVTGDGDQVPAARALMKHGVRVMVVHFDYETADDRGYVNERLLRAANYVLNVSALEKERSTQPRFRGLFRVREAVANGTVPHPA